MCVENGGGRGLCGEGEVEAGWWWWASRDFLKVEKSMIGAVGGAGVFGGGRSIEDMVVVWDRWFSVALALVSVRFWTEEWGGLAAIGGDTSWKLKPADVMS